MVWEDILFLSRSQNTNRVFIWKIHFDWFYRKQWENRLAKRNLMDVWEWRSSSYFFTFNCGYKSDPTVFLSGGWVVTEGCKPALLSALSMNLNYNIKKYLWFHNDQLWKLCMWVLMCLINSLTQESHLIVSSWSKFCLSLSANDPPVLIALAEVGLIDQNSADKSKRQI